MFLSSDLKYQRIHEFQLRTVSAPAERTVLSRRQEEDLSHSVVTSLKLKHRFGLGPVLIGQRHTDF
jgi:hypothetical protein